MLFPHPGRTRRLSAVGGFPSVHEGANPLTGQWALLRRLPGASLPPAAFLLLLTPCSRWLSPPVSQQWASLIRFLQAFILKEAAFPLSLFLFLYLLK